MKLKIIKEEKAQSLAETAVIMIFVLEMIMVILQFSIIITVHLAANYAAWQAARAVYTSSNNDQKGYYTSRKSSYEEAEDAVNDVINVFTSLGFCDSCDVELRGRGNSRINPNSDVWIDVSCRAKIIMPLTRYILGDGAPSRNARRYRTIKTSCIVRTPHGRSSSGGFFGWVF